MGSARLRHHLRRDGAYVPMTQLIRALRLAGGDRWPPAGEADIVVPLPGGEAGILLGWWNAGGGSGRRWPIEFYKPAIDPSTST